MNNQTYCPVLILDYRRKVQLPSEQESLWPIGFYAENKWWVYNSICNVYLYHLLSDDMQMLYVQIYVYIICIFCIIGRRCNPSWPTIGS